MALFPWLFLVRKTLSPCFFFSEAIRLSQARLGQNEWELQNVLSQAQSTQAFRISGLPRFPLSGADTHGRGRNIGLGSGFLSIFYITDAFGEQTRGPHIPLEGELQEGREFGQFALLMFSQFLELYLVPS